MVIAAVMPPPASRHLVGPTNEGATPSAGPGHTNGYTVPAGVAPRGSCENRGVDLRVRVAGRSDDDYIPVPDGTSPREELTRFLNRQGPYAQLWIKLSSGEYVRYEHIISIADATPRP